jgi:plasmid stability protein
MRTTIRLEDHLLREAKSRAARAGRSLNDFIQDAVRAAVLAPETAPETPPLPLLRGGRGLRPGVTLDSGAALLQLMDEADG